MNNQLKPENVRSLIGESLSWESPNGIACRLILDHPDTQPDEVGLEQIFDWVIAIPDFDDDPELVNDSLLEDILREWYEELNPLWQTN
jgi:FeS assembly protein IscX